MSYKKPTTEELRLEMMDFLDRFDALVGRLEKVEAASRTVTFSGVTTLSEPIQVGSRIMVQGLSPRWVRPSHFGVVPDILREALEQIATTASAGRSRDIARTALDRLREALAKRASDE
jgi:hypothetical protein